MMYGNYKRIAFFRVDASIEIGSGHLMRCKTIAEYFYIKGWRCFFISKTETLNFLNEDFHNKFNFHEIHENLSEIKEIKNLCRYKPDFILIDNYNWDYNYERQLQTYAKKIVVIDDLANRKHSCDILIDQTYKRRKNDYYKLVNNKTKILNGTEYAILRKEFINHRHIAEKRIIGKVKSILISIGSIDNENLILKILEALNSIECKAKIYIAINKLTPNLNQIKEYSRNSKLNILLKLNCSEMASLMIKSDLAIGAAGTSVWERCCMGLPTVQFVRAENQKQIADNLQEDNIVINLGNSKNTSINRIKEKLNFIINDQKIRKRLHLKSLKVCDGLGSRRFYNELVK